MHNQQRGLLAPGSQQDPPAGEYAQPAYPTAVAVPPPDEEGEGGGYSAPQPVMETVQFGAPVMGTAVATGQPMPQRQQRQPQQPGKQRRQRPVPAPEVSGGKHYRDVAFMIAFLVHVGVVAILGVALGIPALSRDTKDTANSGTVVDTVDAHPLLGLFVVAAVVGGVLSAAWVYFMRSHAESIIKCTLWTSVVLECAAAAVMLFFSGIGAIFFVFIALITVWYAYSVRNRIPFASANLKTACSAVIKYNNTIYVACAALVLQLVWVVVWGMAFYGIEANTANDGRLCEFFMLVSFFWGLLVIKNIVHCTTAGAVGSWWFVATPVDPVMGALKRACTTSLGSICLGSLIVAVLKAMRTMIDSARRQARRNGNAGAAFLLGCASCLMGCIERLMEVFNHWAFVQVALYGKDFRTAGHDAVTLFKERGWTLIVNDDLINTALTVGCLMVGCITGLIGAAWTHATSNEIGWVFAGGFLAFLVGFGMCMIVTGVIDSAVSTVFVCFAEHPDALAATHPEHLNNLVRAWQTFHNDAFCQAGYNTRFAMNAV